MSSTDDHSRTPMALTTARLEAPTPATRLLELLAQEKEEVGRAISHAALAGLLGLSVPLGVQAIVGLVAGGMLLQPAVVLIGLVVLGTLGAGVLEVLQLGVVERLQQRVFARHALDLAHRLPRADVEELRGADLPELTNRFFEVVTIQKSLAKLLTEGAAALLGILAGLVLLTVYHPYLSLSGIVLLSALAAALWATGRRGLSTSFAESAAKYRVAHWLQELARHVPTFRLAAAPGLPLARMDVELDAYLAHRQEHFRVLARQSMLIVATKTLVTGGMLVIGAALVVDRRISLGQFVAAELVIVTVLAGVEKLTRRLATIYDALTAVEKAAHLREIPVEPDGAPAAPRDLVASPAGAAVHARALSYRYHDGLEDTLRDISLDIGAGERVALVGSEGAGGSTLLRVLAGLLPSYRGSLTLDGRSARDITTAAARGAALVPAAPTLFDGTLLENVSLGRAEVATGDVVQALETAGLGELMRALPDGLRTRVGGAAASLPAHAVRKIALARAIAGRPRLLLLDELFHHLEPGAKRRLLQRLLDPRGGWTVVAASHDPAYLEACDRVLVLEEGRIVLEGTYASLRARLADRGLLRAPQPEGAHA